jgi:hypothetical protein
MPAMLPFVEVLEVVDKLTLDEKETLVDILSRRVIDQRRAQLVRDVHEAQEEFRRGECRPVSVEALMREILE